MISFIQSRLKKWFRSYRILLAGLTIVLVSFSKSATALDVGITPTSPHLGDTISILIQPAQSTPSNPVVTLEQKNFPTFPISQNRYRALIPTSPLEKSRRLVLRIQGQENGEEKVRNLAVFLKQRTFPVQSIWLPPGKDNLQGTDYEFDQVDAFKQLVTPEKFWTGKFLRPNQGYVSTAYGVRRYYNGEFASNYYHRGIDYAAPTGSPVVAPAAGRVALVGYESKGFQIHGNMVGLDHGQGVASVLIHLNTIVVKEGDMVKAGQKIGTVGSTGASTGPHLHWGLYVHGVSIDPVPWLSKRFE